MKSFIFKKGYFIVLAMVILLSCGRNCISVYASDTLYEEYISAQPYEEGKTADKSEFLYSSAYYGLNQYSVQLPDGTMRDACLYVPENYYPNCSVLMVIAPNGKTAEEMANVSQWIHITESMGYYDAFVILFLQSSEGGWDLDNPDADLDYIYNAQLMVGSMAKIASTYLIGYEDGAAIGDMAAVNRPALFSGIVSDGAAQISTEFIEKRGNELAGKWGYSPAWVGTVDGMVNRDCKLPIWIINDDSKGKNNVSLAEYFKTVNHVEEAGLQNEYASVYNESFASHTDVVNSQPVSRVWISDKEEAGKSYTDLAFSQYVWENFLSEIVRNGTNPFGSLRWYERISDIDITLKSVSMDTYGDAHERIWYVYQPNGYDGTEELPAVFVFHGGTASIDQAIWSSSWTEVADNRGFMIVFLQAYPENSATGAPAWAAGDIAMDGDGVIGGVASDARDDAWEAEDLEYFEYVYEDTIKNYHIDTSRIYVSGHSNGAQMSSKIAAVYPEKITAFASVGGCRAEYTSYDEMPGTEDCVQMPSFLGICSAGDILPSGVYETSSVYWNLAYGLHTFGQDDLINLPCSKIDNGIYSSSTYYAKNGISMIGQVVDWYDNMAHNFTPEMCYYVWDNFFCNFSRNADKTIVSGGTLLE